MDQPWNTPERQWDCKCKAAILGCYAVVKLCRDIKVAPVDLLDMVAQNVTRFEAAERESEARKETR